MISDFETVLTLGDSHCMVPHSSSIRYYNIGPETWWRVQDLEYYKSFISSLIANKHFEILETDIIIWSLGEIDIRCHFNKQINEYGKEEDSFIENLIKNGITNLKQIYQPLGFLGVVPPVRRNEVNYENTLYPFRGSDEERLRWTVKLNSILETYCIENDIPFINTYDDHCDENGFLIKDISDGEVHIYEKSKIFEKINKLLNKN